MTKLVLLIVACALLVSTVGATATVSAKQVGHSPIYSFDVTSNGKTVGQAVVNTAPKMPTYVLVARGLTPSTGYTFGYTVAGEAHTLGSADTTKAGALVKYGTIPAAEVRGIQSAQFWVTATPPGAGGSYTPISGFELRNSGGFVAKIACYYSTDGGATWHESDHTKGITLDHWKMVDLSDLGVPEGALVKIHVIVVGGNDRTGGEVFQSVNYPTGQNYVFQYPVYYIYGTTLTSRLEYYGDIDKIAR